MCSYDTLNAVKKLIEDYQSGDEVMKRKIEIVCWILFTICSGICFFVNFMSKPPVDDTHTFTLYMIGAAVVSLLYPVSMFILGLRNRYLYDKLNEIAEEKERNLKSKDIQIICFHTCIRIPGT